METNAVPITFHDITEFTIALGVILNTASSMWNRWKLGKVERKVDTAVTVAAATRKEAIGAVQEVKKVVLDVKEVAVAVNAEVVAKVHAEGVEAGKEIANGKNNRH